jgi:hypothetical protein
MRFAVFNVVYRSTVYINYYKFIYTLYIYACICIICIIYIYLFIYHICQQRCRFLRNNVLRQDLVSACKKPIPLHKNEEDICFVRPHAALDVRRSQSWVCPKMGDRPQKYPPVIKHRNGKPPTKSTQMEVYSWENHQWNVRHV